MSDSLHQDVQYPNITMHISELRRSAAALREPAHLTLSWAGASAEECAIFLAETATCNYERVLQSVRRRVNVR